MDQSLMSKNQIFIFNSVYSQLRSGFLPIEEIEEATLEEVDDNGFANEISEAWVLAVIQQEWQKLKDESQHWVHPTDTEKLMAAFDQLCKDRIIALHNAGYEMSDGGVEAVEIEIQLREKGITSEGYCFYHQQDLDGVLNPAGILNIAFQKIDNSEDTVTIEVGTRVLEALKAHGLSAEWEGTATNRIQIRNCLWRKIYSEADEYRFAHERVLKLMKK
jgi:hypothetical protein